MKTLSSIIACSLFSTLAASSCVPKVEPQKPSEKQPCVELSRCCDAVYGSSISFLYLQPNGSNLHYGAVATPLDPNLTVPAASPNWQILEIRPNYHLGFDLGLTASFEKCGCLVSLNWEHFAETSSKTFQAPLSSDFVGPLFDIGPNSVNYKVATGKFNFNLDAVNVLFGKTVKFCRNSLVNFYTGAAFAYIKEAKTDTYSSVDATIKRVISTPSTFTGVGPEVGVSLNHPFYGSFAFTNDFSVALIMGQMKNKAKYQSYTPELALLGIVEPNLQKTVIAKRWQLIPAIVEKAGFAYSCKCDCYTFTFGAGYLAQIYLNAVQTIDMTAQVLPTLFLMTPNVGVFAQGFTRTVSDYIMTGPYMSFVVGF